MDIRKVLLVVHAGILLAAGHSAANAAGQLPEALAKKGTVCWFSSTSAGGEHKHGLDKWKLKVGKTLAIHQRSAGARYIDVLWSWPNELQNPDLIIVNEESNPVLSKEFFPDGCKRDVAPTAFTTNAHVPDFVFAFAIDNIQNAPTDAERVSPHAIIFLPINTGHEPASSAQEFQILLYHMERSAKDCPAAVGPERDQCVALSQLRSKWEASGYSSAEVKKDFAASIGKILKVGTSESKSLRPNFRNSYSTYFLAFALYHNGVIHGTF